MSKKTSLGHNPLAYSLKSHASFDFIRSIQNDSNSSVAEPEVKKMVASYYLEEPVIRQIRTIAKEEKESFSAIANSFLKQAIKNKRELD